MASHSIAFCVLAVLACASIAQAARLPAATNEPASMRTKPLARWEQCGGAAGQCSSYGSNNCKNAPFEGYECPTDFHCVKNSKYYWQCKATHVIPSPVPKPVRTPGVLEELEQCGGAGGECALYGYGRSNCKDAAFEDYSCPAGFNCVRQALPDNEYYWQCLEASSSIAG